MSNESSVRLAPLHPGRASRGKAKGTLCRRDKRNNTGCVGISVVRTNLPSGRICRFFSVHLSGGVSRTGRSSNRKFNIDTLGKEEAWTRALRCRAQHEIRVLGPQLVSAGGLE